MSASTRSTLFSLPVVALLASGCGNLNEKGDCGGWRRTPHCNPPGGTDAGETHLPSADGPAASRADAVRAGQTAEVEPADARETGVEQADAGADDQAGGETGGAGGTAAGGSSGTGGALAVAKFVGNIDTSRSIRPDFATYWNQFTPENAGKWGSVQRSGPDTFTWSSLDAMYQYCTDHNIIFKQHNFIWGSQQPSWTSSLTTDTGPAAVQNWMSSFCQRYPNVRLIDVVNEPPPHTSPAYADAIGGGTDSTWDWIINAFKWAHEACPNALLILNDYSNAEDTSTAQHDVDIVNALKAAGAPIHGVGCQAHDAANTATSTLQANIDMIARSTGLPVYITEYDIDTADDAEQLRIMQDELTMFWTNENIKGITLWGYVVGHTWRANTGLVQDDGTMRPAMTWLMSYLGR